MKIRKNIILENRNRKPILLDYFLSREGLGTTLIFCHGYKGFKDWGAWNAMGKAIVGKGYNFIKFNFSHNGGTVDQPIDFPDLEAFGNNNYTRELDDLESVIDWTIQQEELSKNEIILMGHSRGGGIVLLKAAEDKRVSKVISLAGVSDFKSRFPKGDQLEKWKEEGVIYITNGRTNQEMPHYFQFYEDFQSNESRLSIQNAVEKLKKPYLIIHGTADSTVAIEEAKQLHQWNLRSKLHLIEGADHVFNTKHPWDSIKQPLQLLEVVEALFQWRISESNR